MSEFVDLMEINSIAENANMEMYLFEHNNFINTMKNRVESNVVVEGYTLSLIKEKIISLLKGIADILRKAFDKLLGKIKEVFSKPIQEASSISNALDNHYTQAVAALNDFGYKSKDNHDIYICRIPNSDTLYKYLSSIKGTVERMQSKLNKIYQNTITSTPDSNHHTTPMMIDDYEMPDDEFISYFFKESEREKNNNLVVITPGNIDNYNKMIKSNVIDSSRINNEIKGYKNDSDKFIGRMQNTVNAIKDDKDTEINMDEYNIFMKSCTTYQRGVITCASGATKLLIKGRHLYIRAMFKIIAAAKANVPDYMNYRHF